MGIQREPSIFLIFQISFWFSLSTEKNWGATQGYLKEAGRRSLCLRHSCQPVHHIGSPLLISESSAPGKNARRNLPPLPHLPYSSFNHFGRAALGWTSTVGRSVSVHCGRTWLRPSDRALDSGTTGWLRTMDYWEWHGLNSSSLKIMPHYMHLKKWGHNIHSFNLLQNIYHGQLSVPSNISEHCHSYWFHTIPL